MIDKLLGMLFGRRQEQATLPAVRPSLVEAIAMLEFTEKEFGKKFGELLEIDEKVRDIFLYTAHLLGTILKMFRLGDEYGVWYDYVEKLVNPPPMMDLSKYEKFRRALTLQRSFINYPYYVIYISLNTPLLTVQASPLFKVSPRASPLLRVMEASKQMRVPLVFIGVARNMTIMPEPVFLDRHFIVQNIPRLPGPRLYYNIEKCLKTVRELEEEEVYECLVEDNACYDPSILTQEERPVQDLPSTEIVYVYKEVKKSSNRIDRTIVIAFAYNLANLLADESIYKAWGWY